MSSIKATEMVKGLEHMLHKVILRELRLFNLQERRFGGYLTDVYKYSLWKGEEKTEVSTDRMRGSGNKFKYRKFHLNFFFTAKVVKHQKRLPREAVEAPSLEIFEV